MVRPCRVRLPFKQRDLIPVLDLTTDLNADGLGGSVKRNAEGVVDAGLEVEGAFDEIGYAIGDHLEERGPGTQALRDDDSLVGFFVNLVAGDGPGG